jgi:ribose transport system permease protein
MELAKTEKKPLTLNVGPDLLKGVLLPIIVLIIISIAFTILNSNFLSAANFMNILREMSVLLIVALAGTLVIMIGSIDLSVGSIVTLSGMFAANSTIHFGSGVALLVGLAVGVIAGLLNGIILTGLKLPSFLVTLGMLSALNGIANVMSDGKPILYNSSSFDDLSRGELIPGIPNIFLWSVICVILIIFMCSRTVFGRNLYAVGGGEKVAKLSGIKVNQLKIYVFMLAGLLCGLAGVLLTSRIGAGTPRMGDPFLLDSIAAVVIGGTALSGGIGGAHRTIIGVLLITVLSDGMNIVGIHPFIQEIVKGLVVIAAVAITIDRSKFEFAK